MGNSLEDLLLAVNEYQSNYRHPNLDPYEISPPYDHFPEQGEPAIQCGDNWPNTWFHTTRAGVYALLNNRLELSYIGKASLRSSLAARLGAYFKYGPQGRCDLRYQWNSRPRYALTIAVPESSRFEASALEEYLLGCLETTDNTQGK